MAERRTYRRANYDYVHGNLGASSPPPTLPKKKNKNSVPKSELFTTAAVVNKAPPFKLQYGGKSTDSVIPHKSLSLADFVKNYSNSLPIRVMVKEGFCSDDESSVISSGDVFNLHFIKKENVMSIQDAGGTNFSVPLNTAIQFGLVYDPVGDTKQAMKGYSFETAGELANYHIPPKIVRVTRKFDSGDSKSSIETNEILIIKNAGRATMMQRQCVKVHSLLTRSDKTLYSDCRGCFLTDPGSVRLYLTDIYEFLKDDLPLRAMIFLNSDVTDDSITHLASEIITLTHVNVELSIIATCANEGEDQIQSESDSEQDCPISIPINLDIVVDVINDDEGDYEELYGNTMHLFDNFNPFKVRCVSSAMTLPTNCSTSVSERKEVKEGYQFGGLKIERPAAKTFPRNTVFAEDSYVDIDELTSVQDSKDVTKEVAGQKVSLTGQRALCSQHVGSSSSNKNPPSLPPIFTDKDSPYHEMIKHPERDTTEKLSFLTSCVANLSGRVDQLQDEVTQLKQQMTSSTKHSDRISRDESSDMNSNMKCLRSLSNSEVLQLLDKMNLSQYKEVFQYEQIDGDTLADCDEDVLHNELSVKNKLHRGRLMKIISGKNSAKTVLKGQTF